MANRRRNNNRPNNNGGGNRPQHNKASVFDSNGPDVRIRGTAFQIVEKYMILAKDASASGDRVLAENYLQHAEHYQRLINSWADEAPAPQRSYYNNQRGDQNAGSYASTESDSGDDDTSAPDRAEPAPQDVVVTRPARTARPVDQDDDLGLPASILGATGNAGPAPRGNGNSLETSEDRPAPAPRTRRVAITAG